MIASVETTKELELESFWFPSSEQTTRTTPLTNFSRALVVSFSKSPRKRRETFLNLTKSQVKEDTHGVFYSSTVRCSTVSTFEQSSTAQTVKHASQVDSQRDQPGQSVSLSFYMFQDYDTQRSLMHMLLNKNCAVVVVFPLTRIASNFGMEALSEFLRQVQTFADKPPVYLVGVNKRCSKVVGNLNKAIRKEIAKHSSLNTKFPGEKEHFFQLETMFEEDFLKLTRSMVKELDQKKIWLHWLDSVARLAVTHKVICFEDFKQELQLNDQQIEILIGYLVDNASMLDCTFKEGKWTKRILVLNLPWLLRKYQVIVLAASNEKIRCYMENDLIDSCSEGCRNQIQIWKKTSIFGQILLKKLILWQDPRLTDSDTTLLIRLALASTFLVKVPQLPNSVDCLCDPDKSYYIIPSQGLKQNNYDWNNYFHLFYMVRHGALALYLVSSCGGGLVEHLPRELFWHAWKVLTLNRYKVKSVLLKKHTSALVYPFFVCELLNRALDSEYKPFVVKGMFSKNSVFRIKGVPLCIRYMTNSHYQVYIKKKTKLMEAKVEKFLTDSYTEVCKVFGNDIGCQCEFNEKC